MKSLSLAQIAQLVGGKVVGRAETPVMGAAALADAGPGDITLVDHADRAQRVVGLVAAAAVVPYDVELKDIPVIQVADVHAAFARIIAEFRPAPAVERAGVSKHAIISQSACLGRDAAVGPGATIGDEVVVGDGAVIHAGVHVLARCRIGRGATIYPGAVLYEGTIVGDRAIIHGGAVIGANGFGYKLVNGRHELSAQLGWVELGDDVEIGAGATIDRGAYGPTVIGAGTKVDNQVQIAHNCRIGRHNMICSQVGVAGSTTTGDYVVMAGQVGVRDHVHIGDRAILGAMAGITNDVPAGAVMIGIPATPEREQKVKLAALAKLPEMRKELRRLAAAVRELEAQIARNNRQAA